MGPLPGLHDAKPALRAADRAGLPLLPRQSVRAGRGDDQRPIGSRSFTACPSAASAATVPAACTSADPGSANDPVRRQDDRQSSAPRAGLARGGDLQPVPPPGGLSRRAGRSPHDRFPPGPAAGDPSWRSTSRRRGADGENAAVGHVEQMHASRCYRAGGGRLGCISCHDPHRKPEPAQAATFYRDRCLRMHADRGCALPPGRRQAPTPDDSCIVCHMPPRPLIHPARHTATTDHRIPPPRGPRADVPRRPLPPQPGGRLPLVLF